VEGLVFVSYMTLCFTFNVATLCLFGFSTTVALQCAMRSDVLNRFFEASRVQEQRNSAPHGSRVKSYKDLLETFFRVLVFSQVKRRKMSWVRNRKAG